jgi:small subunit ribosomal protein S17
VEKIVGNRAIIGWERIRYDPKYERYFRTQSAIHTHIPSCISVKKGDLVRAGECRPINKIVSFVIVEVKK